MREGGPPSKERMLGVTPLGFVVCMCVCVCVCIKEREGTHQVGQPDTINCARNFGSVSLLLCVGAFGTGGGIGGSVASLKSAVCCHEMQAGALGAA